MPRKKASPKTKKTTGPQSAGVFDAIKGRQEFNGNSQEFERPSAGQFLHDEQIRDALYRKNQVAQRWMMLGVVLIAGIIFALWGWSIKTKIAEVNWQQSSESLLVSKTKQNWDNAFKSETTDTDGQALDKAKAQLRTILGAITASSTATTSIQAATGTMATTTPSKNVKR